MEKNVPWQELCSVIEPHCPKAGKGRPPIGLVRMLRMYFVQHWFGLADEAREKALLDSTALRRFVGIDFGRKRVPDGTTLEAVSEFASRAAKKLRKQNCVARELLVFMHTSPQGRERDSPGA